MALSRAAAALSVLAVAKVALGASPVIHVRGAARVNATASAFEGIVIVTGSVTDDTGRPVGGAALRARAVGSDASALPLPAPATCPTPPSVDGSALAGARAEQALHADESGRFCAFFATDRPTELVLGFSDPRGLLDAGEAHVPIDRSRRGVELRFAPTTATFELERESQRLQVSTRVVPAAPHGSTPLPLAVFAATASGDVLVTQGACPTDGATELVLPSNRLTGPGPIDLVLRFAGNASLQPAEVRRRVLGTARVRLELSRAPSPADPSDGIPLDIALGSAAGAVDGGSVEARLGGQTVGLAKVEHGAARLVARFPRRSDSAKLELRYLGTEPWWRPGEALEVEVKLLSRAHWVSLAWLTALGAIAGWLLWGFRRPQRSADASASQGPRLPAAGVHLVRREDGHDGWRGLVRDAHEQAPIPGATVALVSLPERHVHGRVLTDAAGAFELPAAGVGGELELAVEARWHSDFTCRAPPHGELRIDLVSRRRQLVGRLVRWAERRAPLARDRAEPTPGDVKRHGRRVSRTDIVEWAGAVEAAAFGPDPVDATLERDVGRREPAEVGDPSRREAKRDH